jgi:hypothetical protein
LAPGAATALFLLRYFDPERLAPFYERLSGPLWYVLVLGLQTSLFLAVQRFGIHLGLFREFKSMLLPTGVAVVVLLVVFLLVFATRVGIEPDSAYWGEPGVPLMGWQLAVALLAGFVTLVFGLKRRSSFRSEALLVAMVWLAAALIWLSVPLSVMNNSFYAPIGPPNHQAYPNSDAGYYDSMAQSLLIGYPYLGQIPTRPLYVVLLAVLHLLVGERYDLIIFGQTLILALIPAAFYLLGRALHSRAAGITIAAMAILRELTTLLVSSQTRISNSKTLLVDLPTLLLTALSCLIAVRWLQHKNERAAIFAGGFFGVMLLLRTQAIVILPVLLLLAIPAYGRSPRNWIRPLGIFLGMTTLTITPWLAHNFLVSGRLTFDAPFQYQIIASQYRYTGNLDLSSVDLQGKSLAGLMLTFLARDPKFVISFVATHFFATQIHGLLVLPLIEPFAGLRAPIDLYWLDWNGSLSWFNLLLILFYLVFIALGLGATWRRARWAGMVPLAFALGYGLANGLGRFSGWRYDLPADWISYFYFAIGFAELLGSLALVFGAPAEQLIEYGPTERSVSFLRPRTFLPALGFIVIGALPWLMQGITAPRYAGASRDSLVGEISSNSTARQWGLIPADIQAFAASPDATVQIGRVLYPRFFSRNTGLPSAHPWPAYAPRDFPRLGLLLLNQNREDVVLASRQAPSSIEHGADAIVLGCRRADYIDARLLFFPVSGEAYFGRALTDACP